jgi:hypothetical protein
MHGMCSSAWNGSRIHVDVSGSRCNDRRHFLPSRVELGRLHLDSHDQAIWVTVLAGRVGEWGFQRDLCLDFLPALKKKGHG